MRTNMSIEDNIQVMNKLENANKVIELMQNDIDKLSKENKDYKLKDRAGWEEMEKEINDRGKNLGGAWLPWTTGSWHQSLINALVSIFGVRNVVDIGCGGGEALRAFRALGCTVVGIEGLRYCATRCQVPVITHDLEVSPIILSNMDLSYSIETAEHIANQSNYLDTICVSKVICMSAAGPLQQGHHHVTLLPPEVWIEAIQRRGYTHQKKIEDILKPLAGGYFGQNGLLFVRNTNMDEFGLLRGDYNV